MTREIPAGTVNTTLNMSREERLLLGKTAHELGMSLAGLLRKCIETALPELSETAGRRLVEIRNETAKAGLALCLLAGLAAQWFTGGGHDVARVRTASVRVVKGHRRHDSFASDDTFTPEEAFAA